MKKACLICFAILIVFVIRCEANRRVTKQQDENEESSSFSQTKESETDYNDIFEQEYEIEEGADEVEFNSFNLSQFLEEEENSYQVIEVKTWEDLVNLMQQLKQYQKMYQQDSSAEYEVDNDGNAWYYDSEEKKNQPKHNTMNPKSRFSDFVVEGDAVIEGDLEVFGNLVVHGQIHILGQTSNENLQQKQSKATFVENQDLSDTIDEMLHSVFSSLTGKENIRNKNPISETTVHSQEQKIDQTSHSQQYETSQQHQSSQNKQPFVCKTISDTCDNCVSIQLKCPLNTQTLTSGGCSSPSHLIGNFPDSNNAWNCRIDESEPGRLVVHVICCE